MGSASNEEIEREIQAIHAEASRTVDDSLVLSDRIMSDLSATAQIGAETSRNLHEQGEQLGRIDRRTETVKSTLREARRDANKLGCLFPFLRRHRRGKPKALPERSASAPLPRASASLSPEPGASASASAFDAPPSRMEYLLDDDDGREKRLADNMDGMDRMLRELREQATSISCELDRQNDHIDSISGQVHRSVDEARRLNWQLQQI